MILGVAAIWDNRKGLEDFIKLQELLDEEYKIILVGLTSKQKQALPENIIGITRTNNVNELRELYAMADVFLNPTYEDNFPTTNIEALACGTPVITYQTGGSPEVVEKYNGFVVRQGDLFDILEVIRTMQKIKENKTQYQYNVASLDNTQITEKYLRLYK